MYIILACRLQLEIKIWAEFLTFHVLKYRVEIEISQNGNAIPQLQLWGGGREKTNKVEE